MNIVANSLDLAVTLLFLCKRIFFSFLLLLVEIDLLL